MDELTAAWQQVTDWINAHPGDDISIWTDINSKGRWVVVDIDDPDSWEDTPEDGGGYHHRTFRGRAPIGELHIAIAQAFENMRNRVFATGYMT